MNKEVKPVTGFATVVADALSLGLDLNRHLIKNPEATFFMRVEGTSLFERGILDGDILIVDRAVIPKTGQLAVVIDADEFTIREFNSTLNMPLWGVVRWAIHKV